MIGTSKAFARRLLKWYDRHRRLLPWRLPPDARPTARIDPYYALVSEAMLQQTQVATVVPYFERFIARYPTVQSLAESELQDVLRLWQGLGYYSRAKNLRAAAVKIRDEFNSLIPQHVEELLTLPGVGRYTAGAISSIAFGRRAAILDGNVARVLCRINCIKADPRETAVRDALWQRAETILPHRHLADFNSALMELGALVCTPKSPQCLICPVRMQCEAFAAGMQDRIPPPRKRKPVPLCRRRVFCIQDRERFLIEQRPPTGRWAGMWQFVTMDCDKNDISAEQIGSKLQFPISQLQRLGQLKHTLSHRRYEFEVFICKAENKTTWSKTVGKWVSIADLAKYPLPRPHLKIIEMLKWPQTRKKLPQMHADEHR